MELNLSQSQSLNSLQLQGVQILQMSALELEAYIQEVALENPLIEQEPLCSSVESPVIQRQREYTNWLNETDRQNRFYRQTTLEPLDLAGNDGGLADTLERSVGLQLRQKKIDKKNVGIISFLVKQLDQSGYLRNGLDELAAISKIPIVQLEEALHILQKLDPAGIGARSLEECLLLQLHRIQCDPIAETIIVNHLQDLGKHHYHAIAEALHISQKRVLDAKALIQSLNPHPGAAFSASEYTAYIVPDIIVVDDENDFSVIIRDVGQQSFRINTYYKQMLEKSQDQQVVTYLKAKLNQAESIQWIIQRRHDTLLRCAQAIVTYQKSFFLQGPIGLQSLKMADIAKELQIHESTVSRAVKDKYLQCKHGMYPLSYFFSRSAGSQNAEICKTAAKTMLKQLIEGENKYEPLSDMQLCQLMKDKGCDISRRTVAKYRAELNIPGVSGRKI